MQGLAEVEALTEDLYEDDDHISNSESESENHHGDELTSESSSEYVESA